jgi:OmpA-OmpF porin, OOP family
MNNVGHRKVVGWFICVWLMVICQHQALSQTVLSDSSYALFKGYIINSSTREAVKAQITFESMPYGSTIGMYSGSTVEIAMDHSKDYILTVRAEGYSPFITTIKTTTDQKMVEQTIELVPETVKSLIRLDKLIFEQSSATITATSYEELDNLVNMLQRNNNMTIRLEGHTDFRGNARENMKLSERRVEAVKNYLVGKGINKNRIQTKAFGGKNPLTKEEDMESRSKNRRVEVRILSN